MGQTINMEDEISPYVSSWTSLLSLVLVLFCFIKSEVILRLTEITIFKSGGSNKVMHVEVDQDFIILRH